jgi:hypothetical protein
MSRAPRALPWQNMTNLVCAKEFKIFQLPGPRAYKQGYYVCECWLWNRTLERMRANYTWYGLSRDVKIYVALCAACSESRKASKMTLYHAGAHGGSIWIFLVLFPKPRKRNMYNLMIVDQFTKWVECILLPSLTAKVTAPAAVAEFFSRFGCPLQLHTDQGSNFERKLFKAVCELLEIKKTCTTSWHPRANGQVERYNRTIMDAVRCYTDKHQNVWDETLPFIASAIRSSVNRQTGYTPNRLRPLTTWNVYKMTKHTFKINGISEQKSYTPLHYGS